MPSDEDTQPPAADKPRVPPWRQELGRSLRPIAYTLAITQLTESLPRPTRIAVILVVAVVFGGFDRLNQHTKLVQRLPNVLLCAGIGAIVLAVATPKSWSGPIIVAAVVLIACATLLTDDRAAALTTLAAVSGITAGIYLISSIVQNPESHAWVPEGLLGGGAVIMGLAMLVLRRVLFAQRGGFTRAKLREYPLSWGRGAALSIVGMAGSAELARQGHAMGAALAAIASLSWLAVAATFGLTTQGTDRQDNLAGVMLILSGVAVTGLGLLAFDAHEFAIGLIAATMGIALTGGGLSLIQSTGMLSALRETYIDDRAGDT